MSNFNAQKSILVIVGIALAVVVLYVVGYGAGLFLIFSALGIKITLLNLFYLSTGTYLLVSLLVTAFVPKK